MAGSQIIKITIPGVAATLYASSAGDILADGKPGYALVTQDINEAISGIPAGPAVESEVLALVDQTPTGPVTFVRRYTLDETGDMTGFNDFTVEGAPYTTTGTVLGSGSSGARVSVGTESVAFGAAVGSLAVPATANYVEISVWGNTPDEGLIYTTTGTPDEALRRGIRANDGARIELESADEAIGLRFVGLGTSTGTLYCEYFSIG